MSAVNTDEGTILEVLNNKMDRDANNITSPKLPVFLVDVQYPTAENSYTWFRLYSDGWVEQGGFIDGGSSGWTSATITFPINMDSTNYQLFCQGNWDDPVSSSCRITAKTINNATITHANNTLNIQKTAWQVFGMAASN